MLALELSSYMEYTKIFLPYTMSVGAVILGITLEFMHQNLDRVKVPFQFGIATTPSLNLVVVIHNRHIMMEGL